MKGKGKIGFLVWTLALLTGCKGFLDEEPYSFVAPENFYKTAADAELALTGLYDILNAANVQGQGNHHMWGRGMQWLTTVGNDELVADNTVNSDKNFVDYSTYSYNSETGGTTYTWFFLYSGISRANFILERVPNIDMDAARKEQILAEAHFFRGLLYFYLGWLWGGVPVLVIAQPELDGPRQTVQEVMQQAETDFLAAYEKLHSRNEKPGRVNKYTAAGFLAKLYLYLGSCKEYGTGASLNFPLNDFSWVDRDDVYEKAYQLCTDIYANSGYTLITPYSHLFLAATEEAARNEHLMIVQAGTGGQSEFILASYLSGPRGNVATNGGTFGWMRPLKELYDRYDTDDPRRAHNMTGFIATTTNYVTINGLDYFVPDTINASFTNLSLGKYREADPVSKSSRGMPTWAGETDFGILRYADMVLTYAELLFKRGDESGARELIREVRMRACEGDEEKLESITDAYYQADFMEELLAERARELCGEGWRRFDLIRWNKLGAVIRDLQTSGSPINAQAVPHLQANFEEYKIWYPIPQREMEANRNLVQNPLYP